MNKKLQKISKNLKNQDNRITADPIFYVQENKRIYGIDSQYDPEFTWLYMDGDNDEIEKEAWPHLKIIDEDCFHEEEEVRNAKKVIEEEFELDYSLCEKVGFMDVWVNVLPFFTEAGAQKYLDRYGYSLNKPRIYVASAYRNDEWNDVRKFLMNYE